MKHRFYQKSTTEQFRIQLLVGLFALSLILTSVYISWISGFFLIGIVVFYLMVSIVAPFFDVPALKKNGDLTYHSPLFLSEPPKNGVIKVHGGTLLDYFSSSTTKGKGATDKIYTAAVSRGTPKSYGRTPPESKNSRVRGTSYIINEKTAQKIGFQVVETDFADTLILTLNYFNVMVNLCIAKGTLTFPNIYKIKTFETSLDELLNKKELIQYLIERLKPQNSHPKF